MLLSAYRLQQAARRDHHSAGTDSDPVRVARDILLCLLAATSGCPDAFSLVPISRARVAVERAVVPLDGSAPGEAALRLAHELAGTVQCQVPPPRDIPAAAHWVEAEEYPGALRQRLEGQGLTGQAQVVQGDPAAGSLRRPAPTGSWQ
jgi:hypothetical protein